ncbi:hypothetical protein D3C78_709200 [compost metagenome]
MAGPGQRPTGKSQGLRVADHPLQRRRGPAPQGRGQGQRRRRRPLQQRFLQRRRGSAAGDQPASRRQHHRDGQRDQGAVAGVAGGVAGQRQAEPGHGSFTGDQSHVARSGNDPADRRGAGDPGGVPVPRELPCLADPDPGGAGVAGRYLCRDVPLRLFAEQPVADGADPGHRAGGGRCHRGAGEHFPAHRRRRAADEGGLPRCPGSRLYLAVDERVAGGGVPVDPVHGRDHRKPVPRILHHPGGGHRGLAGGVVDPDPDALRPLAQAAHAGAGEPLATLEPAGQRLDGWQIRHQPRLGAAPQTPDVAQSVRDNRR